ncbi:MAG TPA: capsule assembly Wzi family protein [Desulfobacteraceae bacterium]|nr:capsule assembly Wzi family protein [Desulfobacteraceae bacterium]
MPKSRSVLLLLLLTILLSPVALSQAGVSVNAPVGHWSYGALDKLISMGLVQGAMLTTKPITRLEMARLIKEARDKFEGLQDGTHFEGQAIATAVLQRLEAEFGPEIAYYEGDLGPPTYLKPIEDTYVTIYHASEDFSFENDKGRKYSDGLSIKAGLSSHGVFSRHFAFYLNPEYRYSSNEFEGDRNRLALQEGYAKVECYNIEVEAGRDSLWWGPGRHGSLILTDNAKPFDLIKISNPKPVVLPWIFKYLGLFKFVGFWTKLEGHRYISEPEFMGMRLDIKPFPFLNLGASRTILLGGKGPRTPKGVTDLSLNDWAKILSGRNISGALDTDQIGGFDVLLHFESMDRFYNIIRTLDIWGELYGEDEAANLPSHNGYVVGLRLGDLFLNGKTNLIMEHADNVIGGLPNLWYSHHVYRDGYTYYGRIMGHEMGTDARETFISLEHYLTPSVVLQLAYDNQKRKAQSDIPETRDRYDAGVSWWRWNNCRVGGGYRYESIDNMNGIREDDMNNHIFWISFNYSL